jgi:hypothetical protein
MFELQNKEKILLLLILFLSLSFGDSGFSSLKIVPGAREAAMAGTGVASAQGPQAVYFNPAAISRYSNLLANIHYAKWFLDTHHQSLFVVRPTKLFNIGIGIVNFSYGKVENREDKPTDSPVGYFNPQDFSFFLTLSRALDDRTAIGVSGKFYYEKIFSYTASGGGLDVGLKFNLLPSMSLGFSVINFGTMMRFQREKFPLPTEAKIGANYELPLSNKHLIGALDISYFPYEEKLSACIGVEFALNNFLFLRGGFRPLSESGKISTGLGVKLNNFRIEYSFSPYTYNLGATHRFSLGAGY